MCVALNHLGVTVVLTTHYLEEAEELCDTIAIVNRGEVVACEPTRDAAAPARQPRGGDHARQTPLAIAARPRPRSKRSCAPTATWRSPSRPGEAGVEQVLAAVRAAGVQINDLRTEDPDLEDVFLSLTSGVPV